MTAIKRIALIAHDNCKRDLVDWARYNRGTLADHELYAIYNVPIACNRSTADFMLSSPLMSLPYRPMDRQVARRQRGERRVTRTT